MFKKNIYGILFFTLIFIGCGSDSTGGKFSESLLTTVAPTEETLLEDSLEPTLKTGVLLDSSVSGINYKTSSGVDGTTNLIGEYEYHDGDLVEFLVAEVSLGEVEAKELITTDDFPYPLQVAQFLQTIDYDNFTENGIQIDKRVHLNILLKKDTVKDDNGSLFAKRLNIEDFDDSLRNSIFIDELILTSRQSYRKIVPTTVAYKHKERADRLQKIEKNNIELYREITNIEVNSTLEINAMEINSSIIIHPTLKPRLIYSFYKKVYRENLKLKSEIEEKIEFSDELATEYRDSYLNLANLIVETILYTESSQKDFKRKIIDNLKNISTENSKIVDATEECLSTTSFSDVNKTKEAQNIIHCASRDIIEGANHFISNSINNQKKAKEREVAIAYLDLYLSCDSQDKKCLLERFENNTTIDSQLWYATSKNEIYDSDTPLLYSGAKEIINNYITKISKLVDTISEGLPSDSFLNRVDTDNIKRVSIEAQPIKLESWDETNILWTSINIDNRAGADINITSFEPKIIIGDKEIALPNSRLYTALDQSYAATNSAMNIIVPIFIDNQTILQEENTKLLLDIYYLANDDTFQATSKTLVDFNFSQLSSDTELTQFNKDAISLSKSMGVTEERERFFLPTVKLGFDKLDRDSLEWIVEPNDISIVADDDGLYVYPILKSEKKFETKFFKVSNRLDPYSKSTIFVLNIIEKKKKV
ncbi:hypothetical protein GSY74_00785, partial [Sulfurovum sp. bin170]|uniref:hypothetical protein n=1 Tax=Sulfurovum sp. bin170 TaxID=2695268 RepID=UPI001417EC6A